MVDCVGKQGDTRSGVRGRFPSTWVVYARTGWVSTGIFFLTEKRWIRQNGRDGGPPPSDFPDAASVCPPRSLRPPRLRASAVPFTTEARRHGRGIYRGLPAGPNDAGKTTFLIHAHLREAGLRFINPGDIARELDVSPCEAAGIADALRRELVRQRERFVYETGCSEDAGDRPGLPPRRRESPHAQRNTESPPRNITQVVGSGTTTVCVTATASNQSA